MSIIFLALFLISFSSAYKANITVMDEIDSFSGAIMKIKSTGTSEFSSDKYYASEYFTDVGIVKFEIETSLSEVDIYLRFSKDGSIRSEVEQGPFSINGSDILINLREKKEKEAFVENTTNETEANTTVENVTETPEEPEEPIENGPNFFVTTGKAIVFKEDGSINLTSSISGGVIIMVLLLFTALMMRGSKSHREDLRDEKELRKAEAEIKKKEGEIQRIKDGKNRNVKLEEAREKLAKEEKELEDLKNSEKEENKEEEKKEEEVKEEIKEAKEEVEEAKKEE